jgi:hypothetical protein
MIVLARDMHNFRMLPASQCLSGRQALKNQLVPLTRALSASKAAEAMVVVAVPEKKTESVDAEIAGGDLGDGDITSSFAKDMSVLERRQLVETLNRQAVQERARSMRAAFLKEAGGRTQHNSAGGASPSKLWIAHLIAQHSP